MNKKICVIQAPLGTSSGYGARSRDFVNAFIELYSGEFEIKLVLTNWGNTPWTGLSEKDHQILKRVASDMKPFQPWNIEPDLFIQITVPNEFQKRGRYSIGVTAGIESTAVHPDIVKGINTMDMVLISSQHGKDMLSTVADQLRTPIHVLFEGYDRTIFNKSDSKRLKLKELDDIQEKFCFTFVGHWLKGDVGHDRKDVGGLIYTFIETFSGKEDRPALLLKTNCGTYSIMDRVETESRIKTIQQMCRDNGHTQQPNIYLLHGELLDQEMNLLYNHPKVKAHISFTKGEGFGRPLLEAATSGKPLLVTGWSGHLDFLPERMATRLPYSLAQVHVSASDDKFILQHAKWAYINYQVASRFMVDVFLNYQRYKKPALTLAKYVSENYTLDHMKEDLKGILQPALSTIPNVTKLELPDLDSLELPTL